jgi:hypothetical protein
MRCEEFWERFGDDIATDRVPSEAEEHLQYCDNCRREVENLRDAIENLRVMLHEGISDEIWESIRQEVSSGMKSRVSFKGILKQWWRLAFVPMTVVVLVFLIIWPLYQRPSLTVDELEIMFGEPLSEEFFVEDYFVSLNSEIYDEYYKDIYIYDFPDEWELFYY